jgi:hypothetical protein
MVYSESFFILQSFYYDIFIIPGGFILIIPIRLIHYLRCPIVSSSNTPFPPHLKQLQEVS